MPFNGVGGFTSLGAPKFPAVANTYILASYFNDNLNDIFSGLSSVLPRDGQAAMTGSLGMGGFKITNMATGVSSGDAVTFAQVFTSPAFTGTPTAPTAANGTNTTQLATTAFVQAYGATASAIDTQTHAATSKTPIADGDEFPITDSAASFVLKKAYWSTVKSTLKTYFDTLYAALASVNTFSKAQRCAIATLTDAATITPDFSAGNQFNLQLGGNRTLGFPSNLGEGQQGTISVFQDTTGTRTLAYAWCYQWGGGTAGTLSTVPGTRDLLGYSVDVYESATVTMTIATPCVVTHTAHGLFTGQKVQGVTTGAFPTGIAAATTYFIRVIDADSYKLATSLANAVGSTFIDTTGSQSGVHTFTACSISMNLNKALS